MSQLTSLQRIVQKVSRSPNLRSALSALVDDIQSVMRADACSIFLRPGDERGLVMKAARGYDQSLVGTHRLGLEEGLIGLVARRAEMVAVADHTSDPRHASVEIPGGERYRGFLGVPIVDHRRLYGVLLVESIEPREFEDDERAFLLTLSAQLATAIKAAIVSGELALLGEEGHDDIRIQGIAGAPGVAIGTGVVLYSQNDLQSVPDRSPDAPDEEKEKLARAIHAVKRDMQVLKQHMQSSVTADTAMLFDAYSMMLESRAMVDRIHAYIDDGNWAQGALRRAIEDYSDLFGEMEDEYMGERVVDVRDMGRRILEYLAREDAEQTTEYPQDTILIGHEISATQLAEIPRDCLRGLICATGTQSSHVAILARALGVPTVMGAREMPVTQSGGVAVVVDGYSGDVCLRPSEEMRASYQALVQQEYALDEELRQVARKPAVCSDGERIDVYINSGLLSDLSHDQRNFCDGLGLYRTELPFMVRDSFPNEDEQVVIYQRVMDSYPGLPVTLRTLDVGGDKSLPYFPIKEENPFLGWRGIRMMLDHPELFLTQLRAMLRASETHGQLKILLPMISSEAELDEALSLISMARAELAENGFSVPVPGVGVMIEVPSTIFIADRLASKVDFLSVGSNDLIQYLLAVDRNNASVGSLYDEFHPAVLQSLNDIVRKGHAAGKPVSICGEMASDPLAVPVLMGLGFDALSVTMASLPRVKKVISKYTRKEAVNLLREIDSLNGAQAIRQCLHERFESLGLAGLIRAGY